MDCDEAPVSSVRRPHLIADFRPRKSQAVRLARQAVLASLRAQETLTQHSQYTQSVQHAQSVQHVEPAPSSHPAQHAETAQSSHPAQHTEPAQPLVLVAVSGGRDSLALLAVTVLAARELNWRVAAVCVDHHMQPGSTQVARNTRQVALGLGCKHAEIISVSVDPRRGGPEAAARAARYRAIAAHAKRIQASAVLLAHTLDDQAETVLLGLLRSAGPDALVGMPPAFIRHDVPFLRPLLHITRAQTTGICEAFGVQWWDDPTNGDSALSTSDLPLRSQIRQRLIPLMKELGGEGVSEHLASVAHHEQALHTSLERRVDELERTYVKRLQGTDNLELPTSVLTDDEVLGSRLVMRLLKRANVEPNREKVRQVLNLASRPTLNTELRLLDRQGRVVSFKRVKSQESESASGSATTSVAAAITALRIEIHRNPTFC